MNIQQVATATIAVLGLGDRFTFDELLQAMQVYRKRALRIVELAKLGEGDGLCAVWLTTESEDLVIHARTDSTLHRQQFVLHELAHMMLGHDRDDCEDTDVLLPDIPPHTRMRLLTRGDLDSDSEIVAETIADGLAAGIRGSAFAESRYSEIFG